MRFIFLSFSFGCSFSIHLEHTFQSIALLHILAACNYPFKYSILSVKLAISEMKKLGSRFWMLKYIPGMSMAGLESVHLDLF